MTPKQRMLDTIAGKEVDRVAVTPLFMQWASDYIGRTYRDYYLNGDVQAEAQVAVAKLLGTDCVTTLSDPFTESDAYGMQFDYPENGVGIPQGHLLQSIDDIDKLEVLEPRKHRRLVQRIKCIEAEKAAVGETHAVVGWVEGPIAQYTDLRDVQMGMFDLIDCPEAYHKAAEILVETAIQFAQAQVDAGADIIGVGDAAASLVGPDLYKEHVHPWEVKLFKAIHEMGASVKLHVCGNINAILPDMATTGAEMIDIDHMVPLDKARQVVGDKIVLCGNFDPSEVLFRGTPEKVAEVAEKCIEDAGWPMMLQPGCEVPSGTPVENLRAFCPGSG